MRIGKRSRSVGKTIQRAGGLAAVLACVACTQPAQTSQATQPDPTAKSTPLMIAKEGYFYVGGHYDQDHPAHHIVGQLYAEFQIPAHQTHRYPIVMVHGGSQTGVDFISTPDGREGWEQYFLRRGYAVYIIDQVGRGRSPYHSEVYGKKSFQTLDFDLKRFAAGENYNLWPQAHLHTQWPGKAEPGDPTFDNYYASNYPSMADRKTQRLLNVAALDALLDKIGPAILLVHSQSGAYGWPVVQQRPDQVKALVALEPSGPPVHDIEFHGSPNYFSDNPYLKTYGLTDTPLDYMPAVTDQSPLQFVQQDKPDRPDVVRCWMQKAPARQLTNMGQTPILVLGAEASFYAAYNHCTVKYLEQAGVHPTFIQLADIGIHGNGHMMMIEKNSDQVAKVVFDWLDKTIPPNPPAQN